jgi:hypothetical protein
LHHDCEVSARFPAFNSSITSLTSAFVTSAPLDRCVELH